MEENLFVSRILIDRSRYVGTYLADTEKIPKIVTYLIYYFFKDLNVFVIKENLGTFPEVSTYLASRHRPYPYFGAGLCLTFAWTPRQLLSYFSAHKLCTC